MLPILKLCFVFAFLLLLKSSSYKTFCRVVTLFKKWTKKAVLVLKRLLLCLSTWNKILIKYIFPNVNLIIPLSGGIKPYLRLQNVIIIGFSGKFSYHIRMLFHGVSHIAKNIFWGNTEMLLGTYCIGQLPQISNGNGFWHHCRDSGMIFFLESSTVGSRNESSSLFLPLPLSCVCVFVCLGQGMEI